MKHSSLRSLSLTTLAILASLAITARADGPGRLFLSTANHGAAQPKQPVKPFHILPLALAQYQYDDGTSENAVAFGDGFQNFESIWFNQFDVEAGANVIASVSIAWGTPTNSTPANKLNGQPITAGIWSDPNGDGDPSDGVLLSSVDGTMQQANTDTFITYTFPAPVTVTGTSFFIGNMTGAFSQVELFEESIDQDTTARKSWVAAMSSGAPVDINQLGNNDFRGIIDDFGIPGNWLIRANVGTGGGLELASAASVKGHFRIDLPLTGTPGVECRVGGQKRLYTIVFTFNNLLTSVDRVRTSCGRLGISAVDSGNAHRFIVNLKDVTCNAEDVTVTLNGVHDDQGNSLASASATLGLLWGDVNGDGVVGGADVQQTQADKGQQITNSNFREDVTESGDIDRADVALVKKQVGTSLP